jgi:hypothetical protein
MASLAGASLAAVQPDVSIRYRWTQGETLRYRMTQQGTTTMSGLPGGMGDVTIDQTIIQVFRTVAQEVAADGTTTLQQVVESVKMKLTSPMGALTFDSASPDTGGDPMSQILSSTMGSMIGVPLTVVLSPTGAVLKVEGLSGAIEKMLSNLPPGAAGAAGANALKQSFGDDAVRSMMAQSFAQLPDRPLQVGESWNSTVSVSNPIMGGITMTAAATLKAIEGSAGDRLARIATQLTIQQDPGAPAPVNPFGMSMQVGDTTGDGDLDFDVDRGRVRRSVTRMTLPMTMSGPGPDGTPMSMKTTVKSTTTMELMQP